VELRLLVPRHMVKAGPSREATYEGGRPLRLDTPPNCGGFSSRTKPDEETPPTTSSDFGACRTFRGPRYRALSPLEEER
jgi:hypothetical protein